MAKYPAITPELCKQFLRLEFTTGLLFWKERTPADFREGGRGAKTACKIWNSKNAGREAFTSKASGYRVGSILSQRVLAHRVVWAVAYGEWPDGDIDHINGRPDDNRLENLRAVPTVINCRNRVLSSRNTSGHCGVTWDRARGRWRAQISPRRTQYIGLFDTIEEAVAARDAADRAHLFHPNNGRRPEV